MRRLVRRTVFLLTLLGAIMLTPNSLGQKTLAQTADKPNILLILTDDQPYQTLDYMPETWNLLGAEGTTFDRAYLSDPLCCPSRATILTGRYTHNHGIESNSLATGGGAEKFRGDGLDQDTIATRLKAAGYATGYFGKYLNEYEGPYIPPGWDRWMTYSGDLTFKDSYQMNDQGQIRTYDASQTNETRLTASKAARFVDDHQAEPWFMVVAPRAPHGPYYPSEKHSGDFDSVALPEPPSFNELDVSDKPRAVQRISPLGEEEIAGLRNQYEGKLETLQDVDDLVGRLVGRLDDTGQLQETYVVYMSDNGWLFGEHRLDAKAKPYEESIRTPFLVRGPGVPAGRTRQELVANVDIASTFAGWAGSKAPANTDGRSFASLLSAASPPGGWRKRLLIEHFTTEESRNWIGLRTPRYTYVERPDSGEIEIYDNEADPYQLESIHDTADPTLLENLHTRLEALKGCVAETCRTAEGP
ncbi:MAG TPA: sulfatase [Rubrobacter sp.]|nr:sulfatase [Rubrobacter sp.]